MSVTEVVEVEPERWPTGALADALVDRWIPPYDHAGILHGHIRWHQALGALQVTAVWAGENHWSAGAEESRKPTPR